MYKKILVSIVISISVFNIGYSQQQSFSDLVITTAVPFMRIVPDARSGAMADCGVSTSADNNSGFHNPAKFAFIKGTKGAGLNFCPWLRQIVNDVYHISANGFYKVAPNHTVALGIRYFTLGEINFTDQLGNPLGSGKPTEFTIEGHYAFRLARNLSLGTSARYINSNLSSGLQGNNDNGAASTFAVDLALFSRNRLELSQSLKSSYINVGMNISNIGSKMKYSSTGNQEDFIPTNLALGATLETEFDDFNKLNFSLEFNKLLVPSPSYTTDVTGKKVFVDVNNNGIPDYKEQSVIGGMFSSFGDSRNGFSGELKEIIIGSALEYSYNKTFFVRAGYFYEPEDAGGRNFLSSGLGLKYSKMRLDFAYLLPLSSQRTPLDNQMRFSIVFMFDEDTDSGYEDEY